MSASAPGRALAALEAALAALLSCLETPGAPDETLESAWRTVQHAFATLRGLLDGPAAPVPSAGELESCLRLYAVAAAEVARRRDVLVAQRAACAAARRTLRALSRAADGDACDVRG